MKWFAPLAGLLIAAPAAAQSLDFNSSLQHNNNPLGLPTFYNPTIPNCLEPDPDDELYKYCSPFEEPHTGEILYLWQWSCKQGCPWDTNLWVGEYGSFCGFDSPDEVCEWSVFEASSVPEPATLILVGTGLAGIAAFRHRRRRVSSGTPPD